MGGGPESRCVGRVYGLDGAVHGSQDHHPPTNSENPMLQLNV